ncbi:MAG: hypothetical protein HY509_01560 [Acidobacteria bacterium]|nr:hypothetical protein [Acidobacteriota bacterium]
MNGFPGRVLLAAGILLGEWPPAAAQEVEPPRRPEDTLTVIYSLRVDLEMEIHFLGMEMEQYLRLDARRGQLASTLETLYQDLNRLLQEPGEEGEETAGKEAEIGAAEQEEIDVRRSLRDSRRHIRIGRERIAFLRDRIRAFQDQLPAPTESLTGTWEITYMPSGEKGYFRIEQDGTLLGGEYILAGGWSGSLQGTFVNGKVFLQRIDSRLGRSSEVQGFLASDGQSIKGSWQNFDLSGPGPSSGSWVAVRREARPEAAVP